MTKPKITLIAMIVLMAGGAAVRCSAWLGGNSCAKVDNCSNPIRHERAACRALFIDVLRENVCKVIAKPFEFSASPKILLHLGDVAAKLMQPICVSRISGIAIASGYSLNFRKPHAEKGKQSESAVFLLAAVGEEMVKDGSSNGTATNLTSFNEKIAHWFVFALSISLGAVIYHCGRRSALPPNETSSAAGAAQTPERKEDS